MNEYNDPSDDIETSIEQQKKYAQRRLLASIVIVLVALLLCWYFLGNQSNLTEVSTAHPIQSNTNNEIIDPIDDVFNPDGAIVLNTDDVLDSTVTTPEWSNTDLTMVDDATNTIEAPLPNQVPAPTATNTKPVITPTAQPKKQKPPATSKPVSPKKNRSRKNGNV
jgi:outer membrane biosynthesis protein TonB